ncbi:SDR family NAD(P)-dependent oxidoreductase [Aestuariivirga sp.]|uniref:SDR family NAD(P)-dependent oxidoreductase n=1 Tax=Aestuariivirga sp. TaxID=2650926 RepID=UPI0039E2F9CB
MNDIKGKRIFITGAARGLGAAFAVILADLGAKLYLTARNIEPLSALAESIRLRTGTAPEYHALDLADLSQVTLFAKKWRDEKQPLDILINNAATWLSGPMESHDAFAIQQTITANVTGTLLLTRGMLPLLKASPAADILNIVSISGMANVPLQGASVAYLASKHGQAGLTDGLRQELRGTGVRVTAIYPPNIEDLSPLHQKEWDETRDRTSWITTKDVVGTALGALSRARHVHFMSVLMETATSNFHGH